MNAYTHTTRAWSCDVRLVVADADALAPATAHLAELMARVDKAASRFRQDSDLTVANANAGSTTFVSRLLADLLAASLHAAVLSDGAVDPTVLPALLAIGYDRDITEVLRDDALPDQKKQGREASMYHYDWRSVHLNHELGILRMPDDVSLDLGAITKAYTADLAATDIATRYNTAVVVEIGGDVAVAGAWPAGATIALGESEMVDSDEERVTVRTGGIATSTTQRRRWQHLGEPVHHIIDPQTGRPAQGQWRSVTVIAESVTLANTVSTAAIVKGSAALQWLENKGYCARLIDNDGGITRTSNWPSTVADWPSTVAEVAA